MNFTFRYAASALCVGFLLAACTPSPPAPTPAQQKAQADADRAARNLDTYRQLLRIHSDDMAVTMGKDIVQRFPDSAAAKEVQQTLPAIEKRYHEASEKARLAGLWLYQVSPMAGGTQSTATIYSSESSGADRVRLVLRRHSSWGQSVFLYSSGHGFVCHRTCRLAATVDGKALRIKASAPPGGEPALLFDDDKAFVSLLKKATKITIDVTLQDGEKKEALVYEVGGFDSAKWLPVSKKSGASKKH
ncbi:MAG: hypothetical protein ABI114_16175 [Rhodanobacter sp.]